VRLRAFEGGDAAVVAGWVETPEARVMWCGESTVDAGTVAGWAAGEDVRAYVLTEGDAPVGYGELWLDDEEGEVELARIVVAPGRRGRGVGRSLATALAGIAQTHHDAVFLRVHPSNADALRCYAGAGFTPVAPAEADEWNRAQPVPYVWLRYPASGSSS
jgi:[ribosomal protein S18]-alanine N-acetyltransferase